MGGQHQSHGSEPAETGHDLELIAARGRPDPIQPVDDDDDRLRATAERRNQRLHRVAPGVDTTRSEQSRRNTLARR